ncbi:hypothetical protein ACD591_03700 [Rufibacter glacialis]|uniref:MarR family transcriptional regulator n=1 Tax=Rufibacter glacialis TaxID=1259555 RepID=A0A5M8QHR0_9BACT|nr:hypothetical protein [Rufibacter glacialis]KAA6434470.1 hypothetical protein FOE74_09770 [Rufibacter glacialis]GGK69938.1 hypothetical protein GCM10011405_17450 [Rufibacter glacialis]
MRRKDVILTTLLDNVEGTAEPEDHPTSCHLVSDVTQLPVHHVISLSEELAEEGFVTISTLHDPPLLYLTIPGVARARRQRNQ